MSQSENWTIHICPGEEPTLRRACLDPQRIFTDERIVAWRDLPERQNCYLDTPELRLHIKRYKAPHGSDASAEANAIDLLIRAGIATVPLVAWGRDADGRGFLITRDLKGFVPADSTEASALDQDPICQSVADLAAKLHNAGLHHRDLYLCHFMVNTKGEARLIDPGRVARLPCPPFHFRWIVKDIAQLCYSTPTGAGRRAILVRYLAQSTFWRRLAIQLFAPLKVMLIARHDARLRQRRPERRVSIDS